MKKAQLNAYPPMAGCEGILRYWDPTNDIVAAKISPGEFYVTDRNELITTVLGSCISACIRDSATGIGGMNHFMLPETTKSRLTSYDEIVLGNAARYGNFAMENLINFILKNGGKRKNLEVKLFGGAKVIPAMGDVGDRNIQFILNYVDAEGLAVLAQDLGDIYPRKVNFYPQTGKVRMKKIQSLHNHTILQREKFYGSSIKDTQVEGSVELF
jgi:chemotaxis protein CheD